MIRQNFEIIGITGLKGSGKSTVAKYLAEKQGYIQLSFASVLKDMVSISFDWPRELLEGETVESRIWRETVDEWWSERLNIPNLTPRYVLQYWGTEVIREHFHQEFWIASLEKRMLKLIKENAKIVISDCRFENEFELIRKYNGKIIKLIRTMKGDSILDNNVNIDQHASEKDHEIHDAIKIENNGTLDELEFKLTKV
jgi:adenylate kinase family enzyme